jgi:hypothetical protein
MAADSETPRRTVHIMRLSQRQYARVRIETHERMQALRQACVRTSMAAAAAAAAPPVPPGKSRPGLTFDVKDPRHDGYRKRCALVFVDGIGIVGAQHMNYSVDPPAMEMRVFVKAPATVRLSERVARAAAAAVRDKRMGAVVLGGASCDADLASAIEEAERRVACALEAKESIRAIDAAFRRAAGL